MRLPGHLRYGGLVVAATGFVLTRFTVLETVHLHNSALSFLLAVALPLVVGLGVVVVGLALAVSSLDREWVNTVAAWCLLGTAGMGVVTGLIFVESVMTPMMEPFIQTRAATVATNTLVGGAAGGLLIGWRSAANRAQRRQLSRHADRATVLNRILRHEVLNKVTVVQGRSRLLAEGRSDTDSVAAIAESADAIEDAVEEVGFLVNAGDTETEPVDLGAVIEDRVEAAGERHPGAAIVVEGEVPAVAVTANRHLGAVFDHLLDNAVEHAEHEQPTVGVEAVLREETVAVRVTDDGPGLPEAQRAVLTERRLPEYDDPQTGFGLPIVGLLVEQFGGSVEATVDDGTTVTVTLRRADATDGEGVTAVRLRNSVGGALIAGVAMGVLLQALTTSLPAIGGLYGAESARVGWILHLFHSVVFGVAFATLLAPDGETLGRGVATGVAYGLALWLVAAGVVMPLWLDAVGVPATVPMLTGPSLVGHTVWGSLLGALYCVLPETSRR
jgi:two-component system OmpR family sensor kinase